MKRYILIIPFILLMAGTGWAYDIGISGVTLERRGIFIVATATVELGTSGTTIFTKDVSVKINAAIPTWQADIKLMLKDAVSGVNPGKLAEEAFQSGLSVFKTELLKEIIK